MTPLEDSEVDRLLSAIDQQDAFSAAGVADQLEGSLWDLPDSKFGWRRKAQKWAQSEGLVQPKECRGTNIHGEIVQVAIDFTDRGRAFKEKLKQRGITIFVNPAV